jgi:cysteinyl-tRNA synthetase
VLLDPDARTASVVGNGVMTIRQAGHSVVYPSGSVIDFDGLVSGALATGMTIDRPLSTVAEDKPVTEVAIAATSLRAAADEIAERFEVALAARDVDGCVEAVLALEQALLDWSADTLSSDEGDHARSRLREMVVKLGELATVGARDPRQVVGPFVDALLDIRDKARASKDFATSDRVRDALTGAGVEVRDTRDGVEWHLGAEE